MQPDLILALVTFAFVTSITPGPNNLMLMASGANFGLRRTVPHALGVSVGFGAMVVVIGAGLLQIFNAIPGSYTVLKIASAAYMLWLATLILRSGAPGDGTASGQPLTFLQAAAFQWVNPKALAMALSALTSYAPDQDMAAILWVALIFAAINLPSVSCWVWAGQQMRRWLTNRGRLRLFNITMAVLLLASLYPVLLGSMPAH
jgi:threonine/homoserine/homoserine lactone efflux protein